MVLKQGTIQAVSDKGDGKFSFTLTEDKNLWYSGFQLEAIKGDEVEFEHVVNGQWNNFKDLKVTKMVPKPQSPKSVSSDDFRAKIDAGNILKSAVDIYTSGKADQAHFSEVVNSCFGEFIRMVKAVKDFDEYGTPAPVIANGE